MTLPLTPELRQALTEHPDQPVHVVDDATQKAYVLLPAAAFQKIKALLYDDSEPNPDEFLPLAHEAFQDAWDAPGMEAYDNIAQPPQKS